MPAPVLRPYQQLAFQANRAAVAAGYRAILNVSPTGSGKTVLGASILHSSVQRGRKCLWLAHRRELVEQAAASLESLGIGVGIVSASASVMPKPWEPVQVASIQTLQARDRWPDADVLVFDECHHAAADTFTSVLARYATAVRIGLTATPQRGDGRALGPPLFSHLIEVARVSDLTRDGYLVPCDVIAPASPLKPGQIAQRPVDAYRKHTPGASAIVFAPTLKVAEEYTAEFNAAGISAAMVEGATHAHERKRALEAFRDGSLRVLVNVGVLTEGTDLPRCSVCILARGCGTLGLYMQIVGRALRPHSSKTRATIIDLRGVSHEHGHPTEDRVYTLDGSGIRNASGGSEQSYCRICGAPIMPGTGCDECGSGPREAKTIRVTGEALVPYAAARKQPESARVANWLRWQAEGKERGFKPTWAAMKFRAVYGTNPPRGQINTQTVAK